MRFLLSWQQIPSTINDHPSTVTQYLSFLIFPHPSYKHLSGIEFNRCSPQKRKLIVAMAAQYNVNNIPRSVPTITVDWASDYRGERSTPREYWVTTNSNLSTPAGSSETEESQGLEQQLWRQEVPHAISSTPSFWPPSAWKRIVTKQAIANEILECYPDYGRREAEDIAERVWQDRSGKCVQIFTILVLLDKVDLLVEHILGCRQGVRDHDLPLVLNNQHHRGRSSKLCRRNSEAVCCFSDWRRMDMEQFEVLQRRLNVPIFRLDRTNNALIHLDLDAKDILPWCDEAEVPPVNAMSGGSGTVIRVKIHPRCHEFHDTLRAVCLGLLDSPITVD